MGTWMDLGEGTELTPKWNPKSKGTDRFGDRNSALERLMEAEITKTMGPLLSFSSPAAAHSPAPSSIASLSHACLKGATLRH